METAPAITSAGSNGTMSNNIAGRVMPPMTSSSKSFTLLAEQNGCNVDGSTEHGRAEYHLNCHLDAHTAEQHG